jgi:hypothetical protein
MHAHDGCIDHLHRRVMTGGQRIHDPIPDASLPPTNEAVVASGAGAIGFRQIAPGAPERKAQKTPFRTRRSSTLGMPRGLFGRNDLIAAHSNSVSSYRSRFGCLNHVQTDGLRPAKPEIRHFRDYPPTRHDADMPKSTRMTQNGPPSDRPRHVPELVRGHGIFLRSVG